jgi:hypothetical protein
MTAPAPPRTDFAALDQRIALALAELRTARRASARGRSPLTDSAQERAEGNLNALLEYRYAAARRRPS